MIATNIGRKRRMKNLLLVSCVICTLLLGRIGWIQFVQGEELEAKAYQQQTLDRNINPKRGTIWDSTGKNALAFISNLYTLIFNQIKIK